MTLSRAPKGGPKPCVGVLFVHGAGDHGIGATLVEFGEPLIAWLDGWLRHGRASSQISTDRALTGATQIIVREGDSHAPAHSLVRLRAKDDPKEHTWLFAEARWDEAFTPPGFQQVLQWSLGVVPWTVLTQFIGPLARQAGFVESNPVSIAAYLIRVAITALIAIIASAFVLLLALLILLLSLIPIEAVRGLVGRLQRFASSGVGDLYLVLTSPIQRAALSSAVQRDIDWMRDQGCERVALIAHSQGGYVAYQALTDPWHRPVELFITFGSGLIRLTESERARRTSALVLALIGTVGALIAIRFLPSAILGVAGIWDKRQVDALAFALGATVSLLLVIVLWRYFHGDSKIADLPTPIPWFDFLTTEDPVMNRRREGLLPKRVEQVRTQNRGSVLSDHGGYWKNGDQFVPQVAEKVSRLDPDLDLMLAGPKGTPTQIRKLLDQAYKRRRGRVAALRRRRIAVILGTAATILMVQLRGELDDLGQPVADWLSGLPSFLTDLIPNVVASILPIDGIETIALGAAVIVILAGLATSIGSQFWNGWTRGDTDKEYRGTAAGKPSRAQVGFYVWTLIQFLLLFLLVVVGPRLILDAFEAITGDLDRVVQSWAHAYIPTLIVGLVAFLWASSPGRAGGGAQVRVVGGLSLALTIELAVAIIVPGPETWRAVVGGFFIGLLAVALAWVVWPFLQWVVINVARRVEDTADQKAKADRRASVIDYLGFIGLLLTVLATVLVFAVPVARVVEPERLWSFGAILALGGFFCGLALAANDHGIIVPTGGWAVGLMRRIPPVGRAWHAFERMTKRGSPPNMRRVGVVAMLIAGVAVVGAGYRILEFPG